jgi:UrcA family protein
MAACFAGPAPAAPGDTEEQVIVDPPYTTRQQPVTSSLPGQMQEMRITVESQVSYADLDFSKQSDVDTMRHRLKKAARDNCRQANRRFSYLMYVPLDEASCVRTATLQSLARLDEIRASAGRSGAGPSAKN